MKVFYKDEIIYNNTSLRFYYSDFIHEFDDKIEHNYKGSLHRHIYFEKIIIKFSLWLTNYDACRWNGLLKLFIEFFLGLNCNFPIKHIFQYLTFEYLIRPRLKKQ